MNTTPRVWYITGTSRGLGRAITTAALEAGDRVIATARNPHALDELAVRYSTQLRIAEVDVTNQEAVHRSIALADELGGLDIIVNNAGYANLSSIEDTDSEDFRRQIDTNLLGTLNVIQAALPRLRSQGAGRIINVSSVGSRIGNPGLGAYQAAKWAVSGLTQVLAAEVASLGIRVTAIEPGGMATDWAGSSMHIPPVSKAYQGTVGTLADLFRTGAIDPASDPALVAAAILRLVNLDQPPTRLLLGSDALVTAHAAAEALAKSDEAWKEFSRSTDRANLTAEQIDPLQVGRDAS